MTEGTTNPQPNRPANRLNYLRVFATFARNSLVRDMMFRANFVIEAVSSIAWSIMNVGFYWIIFEHTNSIGAQTGWGRSEFFIFMEPRGSSIRSCRLFSCLTPRSLAS